MPRNQRKTYCRQCLSERCGHMHSRRCAVYAGADLEHCTCAWKAAAVAAVPARFAKTRRTR